MECEYYEPLTLSLRHFELFSNSFFDFFSATKLFRRVTSERTKQKERSRKLYIHNGGQHETLNVLHVSCVRNFTLCAVLHDSKQKRKYRNFRECAVRTENHLLYDMMYHI